MLSARGRRVLSDFVGDDEEYDPKQNVGTQALKEIKQNRKEGWKTAAISGISSGFSSFMKAYNERKKTKAQKVAS